MRIRFLSLLLLAVLAFTPLALGAGTDKAPQSDRWVDASFDLVQPNLTRIDLSGALQIHKYPIEGSTQTASDMAASYNGLNNVGAGSGDTFIANTEAAMRTDLAVTLASAFPSAQITITSATLDRASLTAARVDDFTPAIRVTVGATILRTPGAAGTGSLSDAAVAAAFAAGARVESKPTLIADPGYRSVYTIHAPVTPAGLIFATGSQGTRSSDGATVAITLDNTAGSAPKLEATTLVVREGTATAPLVEDVRNVIDITLGAPKANVSTIPVKVDIAGELRAIDVSARFPGILPSSVSLDILSADGLRGLYQAGAISDAQLKSAEDALLTEAKTGIATAFQHNVTAQGGISRADLNTTPAKPFNGESPVRFLATSNALYDMPGARAKELDLALDIGATVKFDLTLYSSRQANSFVIHAPLGTQFTHARGGTLAPDNRTATFTVAPNAVAPTVGVSLRKAGAPEYTHENAVLTVTIDLQDLRVTLGEATGGKFGDLVVDVTATGDLDVVSVDRLPASFRARVQTSDVDVQYLTADAIRLAYSRGIISTAAFTSIEEKLLSDTRTGLASSMGGAVDVTGGFDQVSLQPGAPAGSPVRFTAHSHFVKPMSGGAPTMDTPAVALKTIQQSFNLHRVSGFDTTYTVILPKGLDAASVTPSGGTASTGTSSDGRSTFTMTPGEGEASVSVAIAVTPTFVLVKFWPVVLVAAIVVVLLIGTPIAVVVARRNRKKHE